MYLQQIIQKEQHHNIDTKLYLLYHDYKLIKFNYLYE